MGWNRTAPNIPSVCQVLLKPASNLSIVKSILFSIAFLNQKGITEVISVSSLVPQPEEPGTYL